MEGADDIPKCFFLYAWGCFLSWPLLSTPKSLPFFGKKMQIEDGRRQRSHTQFAVMRRPARNTVDLSVELVCGALTLQ